MSTENQAVKPRFILYGTSACHLCEEAKEVLTSLHEQMQNQFGSDNGAFFEIEEVDIADSDALIEGYGTRIPVLLDEGLKSEIAWPFDESSVYQFMMKVVDA